MTRTNVPSEPTLLFGETDTWPACQRWTWEFFRQMSDIPLTLFDADGERVQETTVSRYVDAIQSGAHSAYGTQYGSGWRFFEPFPAMMDDFAEPACVRDDVLQQIPHRVMKPLLWLFLGGDGSGSALHQDVLSTHAWLAVLAGRKRFALHPPADWSDSIEAKRAEAADVLARRRGHDGWQYLELTAGDLLFIPSNWWHLVSNEGPTIGLTRNVATPDILPQVVHAARELKLHKLLPWLTTRVETSPCLSTQAATT